MKWFSIFDGEKVESKLITNRQAKKAQKRVDEYNKKLEEEDWYINGEEEK